MIKKNTKIIFQGEEKILDLKGGMPLSKGEAIKLTKNGETKIYTVESKETVCLIEGEDQIVNITYTLKAE